MEIGCEAQERIGRSQFARTGRATDSTTEKSLEADVVSPTNGKEEQATPVVLLSPRENL